MKLRTTALVTSAYFCSYRTCVEAEAQSQISLSLENEHLTDTRAEPDNSLLNEHLSWLSSAITSTEPSISFIDEGILMPPSTAPTLAEDSETFTDSEAMTLTVMGLSSEPPSTSLEMSTAPIESVTIDSKPDISSAESLTDMTSTSGDTSSDTFSDTTEETSTDESTELSESTSSSSVESDSHSTSEASSSSSSHSTTSHSRHSIHTVVEVITTYVDGSASEVTKTMEDPNNQHESGTSTITIDGEDVIVTGTATARDITPTSASYARACYNGAVQAALLSVLFLLFA